VVAGNADIHTHATITYILIVRQYGKDMVVLCPRWVMCSDVGLGDPDLVPNRAAKPKPSCANV